MENIIKKEKFRKLSVISFVTGIIPLGLGVLYNFLWYPISILLGNLFSTETIATIIATAIFLFIALSIIAIVCGYVDLMKIKPGKNSNKGKGLDIAGIIIGFLFILLIIIAMTGEIMMAQ